VYELFNHSNVEFKNIISFRFRSYIYRLNNGTVPYFRIQRTVSSVNEIKNKPVIVNIILFLLTFITTSLAGGSSDGSLIEYFISGLPYSLTILTILLSHEFGHYFAARYFGLKTTLPYFIPFPSLIGTMGAIIRIRSPIPDRKALFYIGAMGPVMGFIVSLIAVVIGIYLSEVKPLPVGGGDVAIPIFGDSLLFSFIVRIFHGTIPHGHDIFLGPFAWAGWIGFLITSINLIPIGQLDGGHILYALLGRKQLFFGWAAFFGLFVLSFIWYGWIIWLIISLLILMIAHPDVQKGQDLSFWEKVLGWSCMIIFVLTFIPVPVEII